jgi:hypothetical protein
VIYEFAIEPDLVATWHDRRTAYPFLSAMGPGQGRVPCEFPARARDWETLVFNAFAVLFPRDDSPAWQAAKRNLEILLRHLSETGTARTGRLEKGESWLDAAVREHRAYPFGGILVRSAPMRASYLAAADQLGDDGFNAVWHKPSPPVPRRPAELAQALAPLLRCCSEVRFIDPYFDAGVGDFFEPMRHFLEVAQRRRSGRHLRVEIHSAIRVGELAQARRSNLESEERKVAEAKLEACRARLLPLAGPGVTLHAFVWAELPRDGDQIHNRYVLTELGGISVPAGLDQGRPGHTDDLTVLPKEQYHRRWSSYRKGGSNYRIIQEANLSAATAHKR